MANSFFHIIKLSAILTLTALTTLLTGCTDNEPSESVALTPEINHFISLYYPDTSISSSYLSNGVYTVNLHDSASLQFNSANEWTKVDGRGATLPEIFLYDCLPSKLYQYLESTSNLNEVFSASRSATSYTLSLLDSTVSYNISTTDISYLSR